MSNVQGKSSVSSSVTIKGMVLLPQAGRRKLQVAHNGLAATQNSSWDLNFLDIQHLQLAAKSHGMLKSGNVPHHLKCNQLHKWRLQWPDSLIRKTLNFDPKFSFHIPMIAIMSQNNLTFWETIPIFFRWHIFRCILHSETGEMSQKSDQTFVVRAARDIGI